jgi:transposase
MFFSNLDTQVMNLFLEQLSSSISEGKHALLILDRAGYHLSKMLRLPNNISLLYLPPYSPELNPVENLWHYVRSHYWSNRYYRDKKALEKAAHEAWEEVYSINVG